MGKNDNYLPQEGETNIQTLKLSLSQTDHPSGRKFNPFAVKKQHKILLKLLNKNNQTLLGIGTDSSLLGRKKTNSKTHKMQIFVFFSHKKLRKKLPKAAEKAATG